MDITPARRRFYQLELLSVDALSLGLWVVMGSGVATLFLTTIPIFRLSFKIIP